MLVGLGIAGAALAAGGVTCWMGIPVEKGQIGTAPGKLVEWRIRWACWRWLVETRELAPRTVEWTPWTVGAEVSTKAVAKAAALTIAANRLASQPTLGAQRAGSQPGFVVIGKKITGG